MSKKLVAGCSLPAGHVLSEADIAIKSPGDGLPPYELYKVLGKSLKRPLAEDEDVRGVVAAYCLAQLGKPYNLNFLDAETENAFYCSQLAYKAYQRVGINLNTGLAMEQLPGTNAIIYPQEIWSGFAHREGIRRSAHGV